MQADITNKQYKAKLNKASKNTIKQESFLIKGLPEKKNGCSR